MEVALAICNDRGFQYVEKIGEGAYKETFLVRDSKSQEKALKVFRPNNSVARSQRELDAMMRCDHPNIVKLEEVSIASYNGRNYSYTIEEFLAGGTLTQRMNNRPMSLAQLHALGLILMDAIEHIASRNLVHRDVKPDNIMFRDDGETPVIVDFGLVRDLTNSSLTKTWFLQGPGTPFYAAPEQLNNDKDLVDWRTDQFGLGVVLGVCAFGEHPYCRDGDTREDVVGRVIARQSPSPTFLERVRTSGLEPLARMVEPWPIGRYRTPDALRTAWGITRGCNV